MDRAESLSSRNIERMQHRVLERLCKILAGDYSVKVDFIAGTIPHTDGKKVVLTPSQHPDFIINRIMQEAVAAHEAAGHIRFTNFKAWLEMIDRVKAGDCDMVMKDLVNIVEDARVNHLLSKQFKGSGQMLKVTQKITYNRFIASIKDGSIHQQHLAPQLIALASEVICGLESPFIGVDGFDEVEAFMSEVRPIIKQCIQQRDTVGVIEACESILLPLYRKHYPASASQSIDEQMAHESSENPFADDDHSADTIEERAKGKQVGKEKVDESEFDDFEMPDSSDESESSEGDESDESDESESSEGEGEGESDESDESESESSEGQGSESDEGDESDGGGESADESESDESESESDEQDSDESQKGTGGGAEDIRESLKKAGLDDEAIDELSDLINEISEQISEEIHEERMAADRESKQISDEIREDGVSPAGEYHSWIAGNAGVSTRDFGRKVRKHSNVISTLQSRLKRWVAANKAGKVSRGHKVGILDERRIAFSGENDKIYRRKKNAKKPMVAVSIVVDESGSMDGQRKHKAAEFACLLAEAVNGLGWELEVLGFDSSIRCMKGFKDTLNGITRENISVPYACGSTNATRAIEVSSKRQERFGFDQRMGICIMDGGPNNGGTFTAALEDSCIEWLGIGIDGAPVKRYFEQSISCNADGLIHQLPAIKQFVKKAI